MGLDISQTYAKLGIETTPAVLEMSSTLPRLNFQQRQAKVELHTEQVKVKIDQYEAFASAGLKNVYDLTKQAAQMAYQNVLDYVGQTAEDGNTLASIESGGNPLIDVAVRKAFPEHEFGLDFLPKVGPKFSTTGGSVTVKAHQDAENGVYKEYVPGKIDFNYSPYNVRYYLLQQPSIKITYEGNKIDTYI